MSTATETIVLLDGIFNVSAEPHLRRASKIAKFTVGFLPIRVQCMRPRLSSSMLMINTVYDSMTIA
jgi:hypothetical protein